MTDQALSKSATHDAVVILRRACLNDDTSAERDGRSYADIARASAAADVAAWRTCGAGASVFVISRWGDEAGARAFLRDIADRVAAPGALLEDGGELRVSEAEITVLHGLVLTALAQDAPARRIDMIDNSYE